jgi:hypothetical protein
MRPSPSATSSRTRAATCAKVAKAPGTWIHTVISRFPREIVCGDSLRRSRGRQGDQQIVRDPSTFPRAEPCPGRGGARSPRRPRPVAIGRKVIHAPPCIFTQ